MTRTAAAPILDTLRIKPKLDDHELRRAWSDFESAGLLHFAEFEGCSVFLHRRLTELGLLGEFEGGVRDWLSNRVRRVTARNLLVRTEAALLVRELCELDVPHVLLKGNAFQLSAAIYRYGDARLTNDVDVLIPEQAAVGVWQHLKKQGFKSAASPRHDYAQHYHLPPLLSGRGIAVEIHTSVSRALSPAECWNRLHESATVVEVNGHTTMIPSGAELFWHAVTHAPIEWPEAFRFRVFQDAAVVAAAATDVDWDMIGHRLGSPEIEHPRATRLWLTAIADLSGNQGMTQRLGIAARFDLSRAFRWRLAVCGALARDSTFDPLHVWGPRSRARLGRLLINEATRVETGQPAVERGWMGPVRVRALRRSAAVIARQVYRGWRVVSSQPSTTDPATT